MQFLRLARDPSILPAARARAAAYFQELAARKCTIATQISQLEDAPQPAMI